MNELALITGLFSLLSLILFFAILAGVVLRGWPKFLEANPQMAVSTPFFGVSFLKAFMVLGFMYSRKLIKSTEMTMLSIFLLAGIGLFLPYALPTILDSFGYKLINPFAR